METQRAKTEWKVRISGYKDYVAVDEVNKFGEVVDCIFYKECSDDDFEKWKQIALMLAASPDMLEALKSLIDPHESAVWVELIKCLRAWDIRLIESSYKKATRQF